MSDTEPKPDSEKTESDAKAVERSPSPSLKVDDEQEKAPRSQSPTTSALRLTENPAYNRFDSGDNQLRQRPAYEEVDLTKPRTLAGDRSKGSDACVMVPNMSDQMSENNLGEDRPSADRNGWKVAIRDEIFEIFGCKIKNRRATRAIRFYLDHRILYLLALLALAMAVSALVIAKTNCRC